MNDCETYPRKRQSSRDLENRFIQNPCVKPQISQRQVTYDTKIATIRRWRVVLIALLSLLSRRQLLSNGLSSCVASVILSFS